jgi:hypothetical protein
MWGPRPGDASIRARFGDRPPAGRSCVWTAWRAVWLCAATTPGQGSFRWAVATSMVRGTRLCCWRSNWLQVATSPIPVDRSGYGTTKHGVARRAGVPLAVSVHGEPLARSYPGPCRCPRWQSEGCFEESDTIVRQVHRLVAETPQVAGRRGHHLPCPTVTTRTTPSSAQSILTITPNSRKYPADVRFWPLGARPRSKP